MGPRRVRPAAASGYVPTEVPAGLLGCRVPQKDRHAWNRIPRPARSGQALHRRRLQRQPRAGGMGLHPPSPGHRPDPRRLGGRAQHDQQPHGARRASSRAWRPSSAPAASSWSPTASTSPRASPNGCPTGSAGMATQGRRPTQAGHERRPLEAARRAARQAQVHVTHVLGHRGHPENEACDRMAVAAYKALPEPVACLSGCPVSGVRLRSLESSPYRSLPLTGPCASRPDHQGAVLGLRTGEVEHGGGGTSGACHWARTRPRHLLPDRPRRTCSRGCRVPLWKIIRRAASKRCSAEPPPAEVGHGLGRGLGTVLVDGREDLADGLVPVRDGHVVLQRVDLDGVRGLEPIAIERLPADGLQAGPAGGSGRRRWRGRCSAASSPRSSRGWRRCRGCAS